MTFCRFVFRLPIAVVGRNAMPRPLRIEYAGALYRIERQDIRRMLFLNDDHCRSFIDTLTKMLERLEQLYQTDHLISKEM